MLQSDRRTNCAPDPQHSHNVGSDRNRKVQTDKYFFYVAMTIEKRWAPTITMENIGRTKTFLEAGHCLQKTVNHQV